jgi:hypothetical protein
MQRLTGRSFLMMAMDHGEVNGFNILLIQASVQRGGFIIFVGEIPVFFCLILKVLPL